MKKNIFLSVIYICLAIIPAAVLAQSPAWSVTPNDYQYSLTITATLNMDGKIADESADKVGAFVGNECRGVGTASTSTNGGSKLVFLQVYSNSTSGETITFKMYDASENKTFDAINQVEFQSDATLGSVSEPYLITTNHTPESLTLAPASIVEGEPKGVIVGTFSTVDVDAGNTFTYSFVDSLPNDNASFVIEGDKLKTNEVFNYNVKASYSIYVKVEDGKLGFLNKRIEVKITPSENKFVADNFISPNGDGINDLWEIDHVELYKNYQVTIFNEAGAKIFSTKNYDNTWAGTYGGQALPTGVYFYLVKNTEGDQKFTGSISLLK